MKFKKLLPLCLFLSLCLFLFTSCLKKDSPDKMKFLESNHSSLDILDNNDFSTFKLLDSSLDGKEVFFTGEFHGVTTNSELELKLLKYFKKKIGLNYLLLELSYSNGEVLNQYLSTGDESILKNMYTPLEGTFAWTKQSYELWKKLYAFNQTLPTNDKIKIIGIDIEHQYANAISYLNSLIENKKAPKEIEDLISNISEINNKIQKEKHAKANVEFAIKLDRSIKANHKIYEDYLGEKLFDFELVNENIIAQVDAYKDDNSFNQIRDAKIYDNFKKVYSKVPKGKFYGQWGLNHIFLKKQSNTDWIASLMNSSDSPVKGKILSIPYVYTNCESMLNRDYKTSSLNTFSSEIKMSSDIIKSNVTLLKLTGDDSPFERNLIWFFDTNDLGSSPKEGVTTDYFQFIILIKNGKPTTPLGK